MSGDLNLTIRYSDGNIRSQIVNASTAIEAINSSTIIACDENKAKEFQDKNIEDGDGDASLYPEGYGFVIVDYMTKKIYCYQNKSPIGEYFSVSSNPRQVISMIELIKSGSKIKYNDEIEATSFQEVINGKPIDKETFPDVKDEEHLLNLVREHTIFYFSGNMTILDLMNQIAVVKTSEEIIKIKKDFIDFIKKEGFEILDKDMEAWNEWIENSHVYKSIFVS